MSKGLKITALVFGVLLCLGLILGGIGFALGGMNSVQFGRDGLHIINKVDRDERVTIDETFPEATSLKIDVSAIREVRVARSGDVFSVNGYVSEYGGGVTAEMEGSTLRVVTANNNGFWGLATFGVDFGTDWIAGRDTYLTVTVPADFRLDKLDIDVDACELIVDGISADTAEIDIDASATTIKNVEFGSLSVDADASDCKLNGGQVADFDVDINAGSLKVYGYTVTKSTNIDGDASDIELGGSFYGRNSVDVDAGDFDLISVLSQSDITFILESSAADIKINGEHISTHGDTKTIRASGDEQSVFKISADFSDIKIAFE
jgi:hypothetical protein